MSKGFKKHKLALALSACMMAGPSLVYALGMGEIEVGTSLNEPLGAKIKLFSATSEELSSLTVRMASQQAFNRMGIERLPVLRDLEFELVSSGAGAPYIEVKSSKAIKEPFLDFILSVNWSSGQMMREYTLLLDPPVFEKDQQVGRISAAATEPAAVVREAPAAVAPRQRVAAPAGSYGPTSSRDTLWAVAQDLRPDRSVSVPQMMIGLLKENPEAFDNNNINSLKAGYILRSPEMDVITELNKQQAANEANRQYQQWLAAKGSATTTTGRQQRVAAAPTTAGTGSSAPSPTTAPAVPEKSGADARLQLLTPDEEAKIRAGVGSGTSGEPIEALQQQLAVALESAEVSRQENSDLRTRLEDLEKQLQSVQKLLTLKDDTLGALQADAQQEQPEEVAPPAEVEETPAEAEKAEPKVAEKPVKPAVQPEPVETSLLDEVLGNQTYLYAAGGGFVVLLLLVAMIMRRRRADDDDDFTVVAPVVNAKSVESPQSGDESAVATTATAAATAAVAADAEAAADAAEEVISDDFGGGFGTIQAEESEIDPIAEADVYLAYRRYEQAEALLKEAISADPDRNELKLKLLEIYHATKDANSFEAQAESLYAALGGQDDASWNQAVEMGRELLPDHPLFGEGGAAADTVESADIGDVDEFDFDDEQPLSEDVSTEDASDLSDDDLASSLGFSGLDESADDAIADSPGAVAVDGTDADISLDDLGDLDLDLDLGSADDLDLGGSDAGEGLTDELQGAEAGVESAADEAFDLSAELADSLGSDELDLGAELESIVSDETGDTDAALDSVGEADLGNLGDIAAELDDLGEMSAETNSTQAEVETEMDVDLAQDSVALELEPAKSEFESHDVVSEEDVLAESSKKDETNADIDLDLPLDLDMGLSDTPELEATEELEPIVDGDSTEPENIDPLADMANLGDLDFSEMSDENNDDIFDSGDDMVGTKLDLAKAYIDMGDQDGARSILGEVVQEGDDDQRQEAEQLMQQIS